MAALLESSRWRRLLPIFLFSFGMVACSSDAPNLDVGGGENAGDGDLSEEVGDGQNSGVLRPIDGLGVRLLGEADGAIICPANTTPCVNLNEDIGDGPYTVTVSFNEGVATVVDAEPFVDPFGSNVADRCDNTLPESDFEAIAALPPEEQEAAEADGTYAYDTLGQYILTIPDSYAIRWLSNTQRVHLGVVGDAAPHVDALNELGLADVVCVAGGFTATDAELERVQFEVGDMIEGWDLIDGAGWGRDVFAGVVDVGLYEVDEAMIAEANERFGDLVVLTGAFTVLNGSIEELHQQLELNEALDAGDGAASPAGLFARCGSVVFPTMPPDVDAFPPLDAETQAIFDEFITGPYAVEAEFIAGNDMRIAERTETTLELFGIGDDGYVNASFEKRGDAWGPTGWGGCTIEVSATGFGSAETILDPEVEPDPASTTLHIWIQERECASGQAPVDRDVVPVVVETDTRVEITTLVAPVPGGATCPSNPWFPVVVELDDPLGDRTVVDMREPPGIERTWPPSMDG